MLLTEESDPALQVTGDVRRLRSVGEGYSVLGSTPAPSADRATTQENRNSTAGHFALIYVVLVYTLLVMRLKICLSLPAVLNSLLQTVDSSRILRYAKMCVFGFCQKKP